MARIFSGGVDDDRVLHRRGMDKVYAESYSALSQTRHDALDHVHSQHVVESARVIAISYDTCYARDHTILLRA